MSFKEFDMTEIEEYKKKYASEVKERWGNSAEYAQSEEKASSYGKDEWQVIGQEGGAIFTAFAANMDKAANHCDVQAIVKQWRDFITKRFYNCTTEILRGLGQMYVGDERFQKNIDKYGDGLAVFVSEAIAVYCDNCADC